MQKAVLPRRLSGWARRRIWRAAAHSCFLPASHFCCRSTLGLRRAGPHSGWRTRLTTTKKLSKAHFLNELHQCFHGQISLETDRSLPPTHLPGQIWRTLWKYYFPTILTQRSGPVKGSSGGGQAPVILMAFSDLIFRRNMSGAWLPLDLRVITVHQVLS